MSPVDRGQCSDKICVGRITGVQGLKGWVKIFSNTDPRDNIVKYSPWMLESPRGIKTFEVGGRLQGRRVLAKLVGIDSREQATAVIGNKIYIWPEQLPALAAGEYYWSDLIGMQVESLQAEALGRVDGMIETGANDVMIIQGDRNRLIPFVPDDIVRKVDLTARRMIVDWPADY